MISIKNHLLNPIADSTERLSARSPSRGLRVLTVGHSFHVFIAPLVAEMAAQAGIQGHQIAGTQFLGGSRVLQHWERPEAVNEAKQVLRAGGVDVLTLSPTFHPDPGIALFTRLAREHNPAVRVTIQASWVPFDGVMAAALHGGSGRREDLTAEQLHRLHAPYFTMLEEEVITLRRQFDSQQLFTVVPVGQALLSLREQIRTGQIPGLKSQADLFTDALGHPALPVKLLAAYAHFAVIYQRSPVGLPRLGVIPPSWDHEVPLRLQQLAWEAVLLHPLGGIGCLY
jgi:hypothetical protein